MARPTKCTPMRRKTAREYISKYGDEYGHAIPSIAGLALVLGVGRNTLYDWGDKDESFSNILDDILATQEQVLLTNGLKGTYNANIVKLVLGKHGYHDKAEVGGIDGEDLVLKVQHV